MSEEENENRKSVKKMFICCSPSKRKRVFKKLTKREYSKNLNSLPFQS